MNEGILIIQIYSIIYGDEPKFFEENHEMRMSVR